ncbi:MAG: DUF1841 family protein [Gammaproteobacteria bacterium]|jgi:hypothetical protein
MFGQDRSEIRRTFFEVWDKLQTGAPMEALQQIIGEVIEAHPEYHSLFADRDAVLDRDWTPADGETNPFLHMGMHIAIREQLTTNRPAGLRDAYRVLVGRLGEPHAAEHEMMECLGRALWEAQRAGTLPDENAYLECVRRRGR